MTLTIELPTEDENCLSKMAKIAGVDLSTYIQRVLQAEIARPALQESPTKNQEPPAWSDIFQDLIGSLEGLPDDMAENHDHYIHGSPKR